MLRWARQAGRNAAELATAEQLEAADSWEWQAHVIEPAAEHGVIPQALAWEWAADQRKPWVRDDARVRAFWMGGGQRRYG